MLRWVLYVYLRNHCADFSEQKIAGIHNEHWKSVTALEADHWRSVRAVAPRARPGGLAQWPCKRGKSKARSVDVYSITDASILSS